MEMMNAQNDWNKTWDKKRGKMGGLLDSMTNEEEIVSA